MGKFTVSYLDEVRIKITGDYDMEMDLYEHFTYKAVNYQHHPKYKAGIWNGDMRLYYIRDKTLYIGLLNRFDEFCKERGYEWEFSSNFPLYDHEEMTQGAAEEFARGLDLPQGIEPRDYQIKGLMVGWNERRCMLISATSSGKSLMMYLLAMRFDQPTLIIVPTIQLVKQLTKDFSNYSKGRVVPQMIMGGLTKEINENIVVSTWQSLQDMDKSWFDQFDVMIGDEAHTFQATALMKIMEKTGNIKCKIGTTGTLSDEKVHKLVIEGLFGPRTTLQTARQLMDRGYATKLKINVVLFEHLKEDVREYRLANRIKNKMSYADEIEYLITSDKRNAKIAKLATALPGNTLILCLRRDDHAIPLRDLIKPLTNKTVHLVHGKIDVDDREFVRESMESGDGEHIIVATYGTFKVGINIPRIDNLIFAHPLKAKITLLQSIGRILRVADGKIIARAIDIGDDLMYGVNKNHTYLHLTQRLSIYDREGFDWNSTTIKI